MHDKYKIAIGIILVILFVVGTCYYVDASRTENTISIGVLHTDHDAPAEIAEAQGLYKKEGLNVEIRQFNNGGDLMTAMASGDIDIGYLGVSPFVFSTVYVLFNLFLIESNTLSKCITLLFSPFNINSEIVVFPAPGSPLIPILYIINIKWRK